MLSTQLLDCRNLPPGSLIDVETQSRNYHIECMGGNSIRVSGHPEFCPNPVMASLQGSLDRDGTLETGDPPGPISIEVVRRALRQARRLEHDLWSDEVRVSAD